MWSFVAGVVVGAVGLAIVEVAFLLRSERIETTNRLHAEFSRDATDGLPSLARAA